MDYVQYKTLIWLASLFNYEVGTFTNCKVRMDAPHSRMAKSSLYMTISWKPQKVL